MVVSSSGLGLNEFPAVIKVLLLGKEGRRASILKPIWVGCCCCDLLGYSCGRAGKVKFQGHRLEVSTEHQHCTLLGGYVD